MASFDEVVALVREQTAYRGPITETTSLQRDIGVYGDDMDELLDAYSKRFIPPPNERVAEIPITVGMLKQFAETGKWVIDYPAHSVPRRRWDVALIWMCLVFAAFLVTCRR